LADQSTGKVGLYSTRVEFTTSAISICYGIASFDGKPESPSFAVFLDQERAMLVSARDSVTRDGSTVFVRIGAASFTPGKPVSPADLRVVIMIE